MNWQTLLISAILFLSCMHVGEAAEETRWRDRSYLAFYSALQRGDHLEVARLWEALSETTHIDENLLPNLFASLCTVGKVNKALELVPELEETGRSGPLTALVKTAYFVKTHDWVKARRSIDGALIGPYTISAYIFSAWILAGSGFPDEAIDYLDQGGVPEVAFVRDFTAALIAEKYGSRYEAKRRWADILKGGAQNLLFLDGFAKFQWRSGYKDGALDAIRNGRRNLVQTDKIDELERLIIERGNTPLPLENDSELIAKSILLGVGTSASANPTLAIQLAQVARYLSADADLANLMIAEIAANNQQHKLARVTYDDISPLSSIYRGAKVQAAYLSYFIEGPNVAEKRLSELNGKNPNDIMVLGALGDISRANKKWENAIQFYSHAIKLLNEKKAGDWIWFFNRAIAYDYSGSWTLARQDLEDALSRSPDNPQVLNYLAYSLIDRNEELESALKMVEEALRAVPGNGQFLDTRGWAYFQMGRLKEAEADITAALEKLPGEPVILEHVGDIYWATGRNKESLWLWRQSLELNPEDRDSRRIKEKLIQREPRGHDHNP